MSKSELIPLVVVSLIGILGGWWSLCNGACADLDQCIGIKNCAESESCSTAWIGIILGGIGIIVTVLNIVADHMEK